MTPSFLIQRGLTHLYSKSYIKDSETIMLNVYKEEDPFKLLSTFGKILLVCIIAPDMISLYGGYGPDETSFAGIDRLPGYLLITIAAIIFCLYKTGIHPRVFVGVLFGSSLMIMISAAGCAYALYSNLYSGKISFFLLFMQMPMLLIASIVLLCLCNKLIKAGV